MLYASVQGGTPSTMIGNLTAGKSFGKLNAMISGNYQKRERYNDNYYFPATGNYHSLSELEAMIGRPLGDQYPDPALAMDRVGVNANLGYTMSEKIDFNIAAGLQQSESQKIFLSNVFNGGIPFTTNQTETSYVDFNTRVHGLSVRGSYLSGHDNLALKASPNQYDYNVVEANGEYTFKLGTIGNIVPGLSYQKATYGDEDYVTEGLTFLNGSEQSISTASGFIRADLKPFKAFRLIAAVRADQFSSPDDVYIAYEFAATYKLNDKNLIRAAITRSNSGSFIGNNYLNLVIPNQPAPGLTFVRRGKTDLELFTVNMIEIGYRAQLAKSLQIDVDVFQQKAQNLIALMTKGLEMPNYIQEFDNVPTTATQRGFTLSLNFIPNEKFQVKPFVTFQKTTVDDLPSSFNAPAIDPTITYASRTHENTPSVYGGYFINYKATAKLNVNLNGYYFGNHKQYDGSEDTMPVNNGNVKGAFILNAKMNWALTKQLSVFANARNAAAGKTKEFFGADEIGSSYLAGLTFSLN
jgi:iron complex outermembrane receptor protein